MADIQSIVQGIFANQSSGGNGPLQFRSGQIFYGTIQKLFPNQLAEIKLGSHTLVAKLEIPLAAGQGYWLQVASGEGEPKLRLLDSRGNSAQKPEAGQSLLQGLALPNDAANRKLAGFLVKESVPLTKEEVIQASGLLKKAENPDTALETIKFMSDRKMPMTEGVFSSLQQAAKAMPSNELIGRLRTALTGEPPTESGKALLAVIGEPDGKEPGQSAAKVLNHLLGLTSAAGKTPTPAQETALSLLAKLGIPASGASERQLASAAAALREMAGRLPESASSPPGDAEAAPAAGMTDREIKLVRELAALPEGHFAGKDALGLIKSSVGRTGMFYEAGLLAGDAGKMEWEEMLKPLLVRHLQEHGAGLPSRDAAEQLLLKMNGQQLLSYENGPLQHLMFEVPLKLNNFETTMKMQWSGKRTADGKIDPDFCRIIFYLELERLEEMVVDMQVQNRVVAVRLINADPGLQAAAKSFIPELKTALQEGGYTLSSIHFDAPADEKAAGRKSPYVPGRTSYSGVDIRV